MVYGAYSIVYAVPWDALIADLEPVNALVDIGSDEDTQVEQLRGPFPAMALVK
jgi:hypothetical protein